MAARSVLGKGLNALLPDFGEDESDRSGTISAASERIYFECNLSEITPNTYQPRQAFSDEDLAQLAASIKEKGVLQPLVVRQLADGRFEIIAGERRWRAAKLAGLRKVPVVVRKVDAAIDRLELAIIENIQRQDLNPLDEALAYNRLIKEFGLTQEEVARQVGKNRSTVANFLRILQLPGYARKDVADGVLSAGHARALLSMSSADDIQMLRDQIVEGGLSVREAEKRAAVLKGEVSAVQAQKIQTSPSPPKIHALSDAHCQDLVNVIMKRIDSRVRIVQNGEKGKIEIEYASPEDLGRIIACLTRGD